MSQQPQRYQRPAFDPNRGYIRAAPTQDWGAQPDARFSRIDRAQRDYGDYQFGAHPATQYLTDANIPKKFKYKGYNRIGDGNDFTIHRGADNRSEAAKKRMPTVKWANQKNWEPLVEMVLNNKQELKYNPRLTTLDGSNYYLKKNRLDKKGWVATLQDVNPTDGRNEDEVVIYNASGLPVWVNGYGLAPSQAGQDRMYQQMYPMGYDLDTRTKRSKSQWKKDMFQVREREAPWGAAYIGNLNPKEFNTLRAWGYNPPKAPPIYLSPSQVWNKVFCEIVSTYVKSQENDPTKWNNPFYVLLKFANRMSVASLYFQAYVDYAWFRFLENCGEFQNIDGDMTWSKYKSKTNRKKQHPNKFDLAAIFFALWTRKSQDGQTQFLLDEATVLKMLDETGVCYLGQTEEGNSIWGALVNAIQNELGYNFERAQADDSEELQVMSAAWGKVADILKQQDHPERSFWLGVLKQRIGDCLKTYNEIIKEAIIKKALPIPPNGEYINSMGNMEYWQDEIAAFEQERPLDTDEYGRYSYKMPQARYSVPQQAPPAQNRPQGQNRPAAQSRRPANPPLQPLRRQGPPPAQPAPEIPQQDLTVYQDLYNQALRVFEGDQDALDTQLATVPEGQKLRWLNNIISNDGQADESPQSSPQQVGGGPQLVVNTVRRPH